MDPEQEKAGEVMFRVKTGMVLGPKGGLGCRVAVAARASGGCRVTGEPGLHARGSHTPS